MSDANVPATQAGGALATGYDYGTHKSEGFEGILSTDLSLPFLTILQALSPQVAEGSEEKIEGAKPGMLYNTVTNELYEGASKGVIVQPVAINHVFVEWKPRNAGGGFVGVHDAGSDIVTKAKAASTKFGKYNTDAGNELSETYYVIGLLHRSENPDEQAKNGAEPILLTFQSTKITPWKKFMTRMMYVIGRPPLFAHRMRLTTTLEKRTSGTSYNYVITGLAKDDLVASLIAPGTDSGKALLNFALDLSKSFKAGVVSVNYSGTKAASGGGGKDGQGEDDDIPF